MVSTKYLIKLQRKLKREGSYKTPLSIDRLRKDFEEGKAFIYGVRRTYSGFEQWLTHKRRLHRSEMKHWSGGGAY